MAAPHDPLNEPGLGPAAVGPDGEPPMYADEPDDFVPARSRPRGPGTAAQPPAGSGAAGPGQGAGSAPGHRAATTTGGAAAEPRDQPGPATGPAPSPSDTEPLQARISELEKALADERSRVEAAVAEQKARAEQAQDNFLRASAEMENVRRRGQEEVAKAHKFAIESFAEALLPVKDSLEMALKVDVPSIESLKEGVEATLRQLSHAFERNRLIELDPLHQKFDPNQHQAISMVATREVPAGHVVSVLQKGYMINDRVLRPALVTVSQSG